MADDQRRAVDPALLVVLGGVSAALHVGKLPVALPVLRDALGVGVVEAGFLLSLVQAAGMTAGLAVGLAADAIGLRRCIVVGLVVLGVASAAGGFAQGATALLVARGCEGVGLLLAALPAPALIRRSRGGRSADALLGVWGAYMPAGVAVALLLGPWALGALGWRGWWWLLAAQSIAVAAWIAVAVPADPPHADGVRRVDESGGGNGAVVPRGRLTRTLTSAGPWLLAAAFAMYSGQWLAVIGFLPSIYADAGVAATTAGVLTALAAASNGLGNVVAGRLLARGVAAPTLIRVGFAAMLAGGLVAFAALPFVGPTARYLAVVGFSMLGGLIPGTLFALSVRIAPDAGTISSTVGWMQQLSALGQFAGPPLVAFVASRAGGWQWSWTVTGACAAAGWLLAGRIGAMIQSGRPERPS